MSRLIVGGQFASTAVDLPRPQETKLPVPDQTVVYLVDDKKSSKSVLPGVAGILDSSVSAEIRRRAKGANGNGDLMAVANSVKLAARGRSLEMTFPSLRSKPFSVSFPKTGVKPTPPKGPVDYEYLLCVKARPHRFESRSTDEKYVLRLIADDSKPKPKPTTKSKSAKMTASEHVITELKGIGTFEVSVNPPSSLGKDTLAVEITGADVTSIDGKGAASNSDYNRPELDLGSPAKAVVIRFGLSNLRHGEKVKVRLLRKTPNKDPKKKPTVKELVVLSIPVEVAD